MHQSQKKSTQIVQKSHKLLFSKHGIWLTATEYFTGILHVQINSVLLKHAYRLT